MKFDQIKNVVEFASHLPRYRQIVSVLWKYGFGDVLKLVALKNLLGMEDVSLKVHESGILARPMPERMRMALEELGPTFIKFGQIVSSRRDLITDDYYVELCKLQSDVPPFPVEKAREILAEELGDSVDVLFAKFDNEPVGSASIAQVHRATLKDGRKVAIKIQRPDIEKTIALDLAIMKDLAYFAERHVAEIGSLNPSGMVEEFSISLTKELDFTNEASNAERFAQQFQGNPWIKVPEIVSTHSTERVLTMEYLSGLPADDPSALEAAGISPAELARHMTSLIYEQVFDHGFFHGDPHPGNMMVLHGGVTGLIDYGMMGTLNPRFRTSIAQLVAGLVEKNHQQVMVSILEMSEEGYVANTGRMLTSVEEFSEEYLNRPLAEINLGAALNRLLEVLRNNHLRMKGSFYLGIKALTQVEAIGRTLDPDLNFIELGEPYATKLISKKYAPRRIFDLLRKFADNGLDFADVFPNDFRNFYLRLKRGKISIPLEHKIDPHGFEPLRKTMDSIANRLAEAIITSAVLVCSSILVLSKIPPKIAEIPVFGLLGLIWGFVMCLRLVYSIWKHGGT